MLSLRDDGFVFVGSSAKNSYLWTQSPDGQIGISNESGNTGFYIGTPKFNFTNGSSGANIFTNINPVNGQWLFGEPNKSINTTILNGESIVDIQGSTGSYALRIYATGSIPLLYVKTDGNTGFGTSSPTNKVHIFSSNPGAFRLQDTTENNGYFLVSDSNGVGTWTSSLPLTVGTTPVTSGTNGRVFFQELGLVQQDGSLFWDNTNKRLGVGGSASVPQNTLQVYGASSTFALRVGQNTANTDGVWTGISFFNSSTVTGGNTSTGQANIKVYRYTGGLAGEMEFNVGTASVMRLVKEGYVSIGSLTASARLDVRAQGASASDLAFRVGNSSNTANLLVVKGDGVLNAPNLPTSAIGLTAGDIWNNGGVLNIIV